MYSVDEVMARFPNENRADLKKAHEKAEGFEMGEKTGIIGFLFMNDSANDDHQMTYYNVCKLLAPSDLEVGDNLKANWANAEFFYLKIDNARTNEVNDIIDSLQPETLVTLLDIDRDAITGNYRAEDDQISKNKAPFGIINTMLGAAGKDSKDMASACKNMINKLSDHIAQLSANLTGKSEVEALKSATNAQEFLVAQIISPTLTDHNINDKQEKHSALLIELITSPNCPECLQATELSPEQAGIISATLEAYIGEDDTRRNALEALTTSYTERENVQAEAVRPGTTPPVEPQRPASHSV